MNKKVNLSIVIPCYNEEKNLENLIKSIELILKRNKFIQFVLVNNGSTDNTKKIIQSMNNQNILIVNLKNNLGYGHGIMSGVKRSTGKVIAWCHSDLQVKLKDVISAYLKNKKNLENNYVLVKGKRTNRSIFDIFFTFFMSVIVNTILMLI